MKQSWVLFFLMGTGWISCQDKKTTTRAEDRPVSQAIAETDSAEMPLPGAFDAPNYAASDFKIEILPAEAGTFGYQVLIDGKSRLRQLTIPGLPGTRGFSTREKAQRAAELTVQRIKNNTVPPVPGTAELDSLDLLDE